jgi:hypothetical protein
MESETVFLSTNSPWFAGTYTENDKTILRWELPQPLKGSFISLLNYSMLAGDRKSQTAVATVPIRMCCNLIFDTWKNPESCFGDIFEGHGLYSDDKWEMDGKEYHQFILKCGRS